MVKIISFFAMLLVMVSMTGCMTFNSNALPAVEEFKVPKSKPVIQSKVESFSKMTNGAGTDYLRGGKIGNGILANIMNKWKSKELISDDAGKPSSMPSDYSLVLSGSSDEQYSPFAARLTGATLFLIPSFASVEQAIKVELTDNKTSKKYVVEAKDSYNVVMHLLFLPLFIVQGVGASSMHNHMADYVYSELTRQGAFN
jgi:hypothetical protein